LLAAASPSSTALKKAALNKVHHGLKLHKNVVRKIEKAVFNEHSYYAQIFLKYGFSYDNCS
jgi:hypothetical protein